MRQCLACPNQYQDDVALCPSCNSPRSVRIAGSAAAPGGGGGLVDAVQHSVHEMLWGKEWTPNGVRWAGALMVMLELPSLLAMPRPEMVFIMIIPFAILCSGALILFEVGGEWSEWLGKIFCGFEMVRAVRGALIAMAFGGFGLLVALQLIYGAVLIGILVLLVQGYSNPKSARLVRVLASIVLLNFVLCIAALIVLRSAERSAADTEERRPAPVHAPPAAPARRTPATGDADGE
jgi:hypothetical protein